MEGENRALEMPFRVMRASRWLGVAPYRSLRPPRVSRAFQLYGKIFFICCAGLITIGATITIISKYVYATTRSRKLLFLSTFLGTFCSIGILYIGMFKAGDRLRSTFEYLSSLKKICKNIGGVLSEEPSLQQLCAYFVAIQLVLEIMNFADIWISVEIPDIFRKMIYTVLCGNSKFFYTNLVMLQFVIEAMTTNSSFRTINDRLEEVLYEQQLFAKYDKNGSTDKEFCNSDLRIPMSSINMTIDVLGILVDENSGRYKLPHQKVHLLANAYVLTCAVVRQQKDSNKALLALLLIDILVKFFTSVYAVILNVQENNFAVVSLFGILWYILHSCRVMLLVEPSHAMSEEIDRTYKLISKLMHAVRSRHDPLLPELGIFLLHLKLNRPSYVAMGLYTLSRSLVLAMLAVCTTYLAIF